MAAGAGWRHFPVSGSELCGHLAGGERRAPLGEVRAAAGRCQFRGPKRQGPFSLFVPFREMVGIRNAPTPERLAGRPTLIVERRGTDAIRIASVDAPGIIEMSRAGSVHASREASLTRASCSRRPLREAERDRAERLLATGPPFDPERAALERHEVFLTDHEAIFDFDAVLAFSVETLLADARVWASAAAWHDVVAGRQGSQGPSTPGKRPPRPVACSSSPRPAPETATAATSTRRKAVKSELVERD